MKTTVVPAEITTVEDRIAGNLTFLQIFLLIVPLLTSTAFFILIPPHMKINGFKTFFLLLQWVFFGALALRIRGKVVMDWLLVYLRFTLRPRIYVFSKNDTAARNIPIVEREIAPAAIKKQVQRKSSSQKLARPKEITSLLEHPDLSFGFTFAKKGGINVSLEQRN